MSSSFLRVNKPRSPFSFSIISDTSLPFLLILFVNFSSSFNRFISMYPTPCFLLFFPSYLGRPGFRHYIHQPLKMSLTVTYFPFPGRGYVTRTCLKMAGIPFTDESISFPDFQAGKSNTAKFPLNQVPTMTLANGTIVTQSGAMARYAGRLAGLYPTDPEEQLLCDEIVEVVNEFGSKVPHHRDAEEKKKLREAFVADVLPKYMTFIANKSKVTPIHPVTYPIRHLLTHPLTHSLGSLFCQW